MNIKRHRFEFADMDNPVHAGLVCRLCQASRDILLDDFNSDVILFIQDMQRELSAQNATGWVCKVDGEPAGILWVSVDTRGIGEMFGGCLPEYRKGLARHTASFSRAFLDYCFHPDGLNLRKVRAETPVYNHKAEKLLKGLGFRKEGLLQAETLRNGKPENHVRLRLLREEWENGKEKKQQLQ
jgi:hypothetical protein